jgi:hypothetical protein
LGDAVPRPRKTVSPEQNPDYLEWYNLPGRGDWKLCWCESEGEFAEAAVKTAREVYGVREPYVTMGVNKHQARSGDWLLTSRFAGITNLEWVHVDFVVKARESEAAFEREFPFQAVQANRPKAYRPPFKITNRFRQAFKKAVKGYGLKRIERLRSMKPPKELLRKISKQM